MRSEGSCDTKDWSNDAENSALITGINYIYLDRKHLTLLVFISVLTVFLVK